MSSTPASGTGGRLRYLAAYAAKLTVDKEMRNARRARTHLRALRKLNPNLRVIGVADDGGTTFVHGSDDVITPLLLARGHFQRDDFHRSRALVERLAPRPGAATFVDVGANVGTTTLYAARTGAFDRLVAMEPSPDNLAMLRLNVDANGLADRVQIVAAACGAEPGTVELMLSSQSAGDHRVRRADELPSTHQTTVQVPLQPLDATLAEAGVDPKDITVVWVDTQGHEPGVLAGAEATIAAGVPFIIEFWPEMYVQAGSFDALLERLTSSFRGYVDVRDPSEAEHPMSDLRGLADLLLTKWHGQTDLVLLPKR